MEERLVRFVLTEGNWIQGAGAIGPGAGHISSLTAFFDHNYDFKVLDSVIPFVLGNPESAILAAMPLPIIGAPYTPQQIMWRHSLMLAGLHTGIFKGDDQMVQEMLGSLSVQPSDQGMWIGPGCEWFV